jgi:hypothetical protein
VGRRECLFDRRARVVMQSVAVSVVIWSALTYIVWCIHTGEGEHLFRCAASEGGACSPTASKTQAKNTMTAPTKTNGMADARRPLAQMLTFLITSVNPASGGFAISTSVLGLKFLYT